MEQMFILKQKLMIFAQQELERKEQERKELLKKIKEEEKKR